MPLADRFPAFPWDTLGPATRRANAHPDGIVDLSVGTPVDPTPEVAIRALTEAADAPGYPVVAGTPDLVASIIDYLQRRWHSLPLDGDCVLPVIGTKELVAWLPTLLGASTGDVLVHPECAYPTYEIGALVAGAKAVALDDPDRIPDDTRIIWLNSPANPSGRMLSETELRAWVAAARERRAVLASDECYGEFAWDAEALSVLDPRINDGDMTGLLAVHSVSKRSNAAGYRAGFVAGDPALVAPLLAARKHLGMMMPAPVQAALKALLDDEDHVDEQRARYLARRELLRRALTAAGYRIDHSEGGLYLWATLGEPCRDTVDRLAELGILVAPGDFYGPDAHSHVRIALTATDERIDAAVRRLLADT